MIDSPNVEERIKGMIGMNCTMCLDSGIEQTWDEELQSWCMVYEIDPVRDGEGKEVKRMKVCNHGKMENLGY
jgi:hypothetical protein